MRARRLPSPIRLIPAVLLVLLTIAVCAPSVASAATISGRVTKKADGTAAPFVLVEAFQYDSVNKTWFEGGSAVTGNFGGYNIKDLAGGNYRLFFEDESSPAGELAYEYYAPPLGTDTLESAADVPAGSTNVDIALMPAGHITGHLFNKSTGQYVSDATVYELQLINGKWQGTYRTPRTDSNGFFDVGGLRPGTYRIHFVFCAWQDYYKGAFTNNQATDIVVAQGATENRDETVTNPATVSGTVSEQGTGKLLENIVVTASVPDSNGGWVTPIGCGCWTDASGNYSIPDIPADAGKCRLQFYDYLKHEYITSFYHGAGSISDAQDVAVTPGGTASNINEQMSKPANPYSVSDGTGVSLGFTNLTGGTPTPLVQPTAPQNTPSQFQLLGACYDIHPNASFSGLVTVTIPYDPTQVTGDAWNLKMMHYEGGVWKDITINVDQINHTVTGQTSSFSVFGVFEPRGSGGTPTSTPASSDWSLALLALSAVGVAAVAGRRARNAKGA